MPYYTPMKKWTDPTTPVKLTRLLCTSQEELPSSHMGNVQNPYCLMIVTGYTTEYDRDYHKPLMKNPINQAVQRGKRRFWTLVTYVCRDQYFMARDGVVFILTPLWSTVYCWISFPYPLQVSLISPLNHHFPSYILSIPPFSFVRSQIELTGQVPLPSGVIKHD